MTTDVHNIPSEQDEENARIIRNKFQNAIDRLTDAYESLEYITLHMSPLVVSWFHELDDLCECGRNPSIGVRDIAFGLHDLLDRFSQQLKIADEKYRDIQILRHKRGSKRSGLNLPIVQHSLWGREHLHSFEPVLPPSVEHLPQIQRPSKEPD